MISPQECRAAIAKRESGVIVEKLSDHSLQLPDPPGEAKDLGNDLSGNDDVSTFGRLEVAELDFLVRFHASLWPFVVGFHAAHLTMKASEMCTRS